MKSRDTSGDANSVRLKPTGQTPLYYTVIKALEMLEKDKENRGTSGSS